MVENKAKKSVVKEEKVKKENPEQLKESKEYKLKNLKDFYEKELISKEVYEKRQLEILSEKKTLKWSTSLVNMDQKQLKIREKGQNSVTNFQLSKFYRPESTDIKGFSKSGTIEWE